LQAVFSLTISLIVLQGESIAKNEEHGIENIRGNFKIEPTNRQTEFSSNNLSKIYIGGDSKECSKDFSKFKVCHHSWSFYN
jgi:hypothetical protein